MSLKRKRDRDEPTENAEPDRKIKVAVDFGTTFTGIAWAQTGKPDSQTPIVQWPTATSQSLEGKTESKVPTEIQYDGHDFRWGFQINPSVKRHQWFKLGLDPSQNRATELASTYPDPLAAPPGYGSSDEKLCTDFLGAIVKHTGHVLRHKLPESALRSTPIEYILTVPAVWSDAAQAKTRKCAERAGMGSGSTLHMISEPEAAAIYALDRIDKHDLQIGDTFVVCDAGGGTVDLITYTVSALEPILKVTEASPGSGALCGASFLDRRFHAFLEQKLGKEPGWDEEVLEDAMRYFKNEIKKEFCGTFGDKFAVSVPGLTTNEHLGIRRGKLHITGVDLRAIFEPVFAEVLALVVAQIKAAKVAVKAVLLVGGFGDNAYLRDSIRQQVLPHKVKVMQTQNGWTAIVRGALMKGLASTSPGSARVGISARSARKHYGVWQSIDFNEDEHDLQRRRWDHYYGRYRISTMGWFQTKGSLIQEDKPMRLPYVKTQLKSHGPFTSFGMTIHACSDPNNVGAPLYKDPRVYELAKIRGDLSRIPTSHIPTREGADGKMHYLLDYEIQVTYYSAYTNYELFYNHINYGSVTAEYV